VAVALDWTIVSIVKLNRLQKGIAKRPSTGIVPTVSLVFFVLEQSFTPSVIQYYYLLVNTCLLFILSGSVKIWKPKVTPMSDLRPKEMNQIAGGAEPDMYIQKTSLAADKQVTCLRCFSI